MILRKILFILAVYFFYRFFRQLWQHYQLSDQDHYTLSVHQAYQEFNLSSDATFDDIKRQYRQLSKKHHPDNHKDSKSQLEKMKKINAAYSILKKHFQNA